MIRLFAPTIVSRSGVATLFAAAGKGFVPFGTDDPMSRPPIRFPVNHHLSQILERAVAIAGVRAGTVTLEAALFNGDEPVSPQSWPSLSRFGDSWASRVTLRPRDGLDLQGSYAFVNSPENRPGAGPGDVHWSASGRWERGPAYALLEWARTSVSDGVFIYHSVLAEAAVSRGRHRAYVRAERTERPEEERMFDNFFRIVRPVFDNSVLGVTRWTILTIGDAFTAKRMGTVQLSSFAEASAIWIAKVGGGVFDPSTFYGGERGFALTVGVRLSAGMRMPRMGQYSSPMESHETMMHHGE